MILLFLLCVYSSLVGRRCSTQTMEQEKKVLNRPHSRLAALSLSLPLIEAIYFILTKDESKM